MASWWNGAQLGDLEALVLRDISGGREIPTSSLYEYDSVSYLAQNWPEKFGGFRETHARSQTTNRWMFEQNVAGSSPVCAVMLFPKTRSCAPHWLSVQYP